MRPPGLAQGEHRRARHEAAQADAAAPGVAEHGAAMQGAGHRAALARTLQAFVQMLPVLLGMLLLTGLLLGRRFALTRNLLMLSLWIALFAVANGWLMERLLPEPESG
jgi:hypothetical protein